VTTRFDALRTPRLLVRRWRDGDRAPFAAMNADPRVRRYFPDLQDRAASDASIEAIERRFETVGVGLWALQVLETGDTGELAGEFIGYTGLNPMPDGVPGAGGWEIGWRLAAHAWHRGYATEAARAVLDLAFRPPETGLGLDVVWSMTAVLNEPSIAVMRRLGLTEYARADHPHLATGHPLRPHVFHRATAAEYASRAKPGR